MHADPVPSSSDVHLRIGHLTTVDMSLALLLGTELEVDVEHGHEVFGFSAPGPYVKRVEALGVRHIPLTALTRAWDPLRDGRAFFQLLRALRRLDLDVLHTHNPKTGVMGRIAGRLARVPVVVNTCHGLWASPEDSLAKRTFVYGLEAIAARFSDYELFQNAQDEATLRRFLKRGRHRVVGNGVDLARFTPDPEGRRRVRAELGIADDELLVGTVGRRVREKGLAEFAEAARTLAGKATFVWVGPEDDTDADAASIDTRAVRFVAERTDMPAVYSAFDVFVLASYREGFSRASMEAAACGLPMVLTDIRGCREVGDDAIHLLLAPVRDGAALASAVERLIGDATLRTGLAASARERALGEFDQRAVAGASLDTYTAVARRRHLRHLEQRDGRVTVLHVLPNDLDRGAQVYAGQLRDALADNAEQRHRVVAVFDAPGGALRPDVSLGIKSGMLRRAGLDHRAVLALRRTMRSEGAEVVVAHGGEPLKYVVAAAGRVPIVYYKVGLSSAELRRRSRTLLYGALARRAARVVGVSQAILDQTRDLLRVPEEKLALVPNGRDPEKYHPATHEEERADPPMLLFVGQLETGKRPGLFFDVVEVLRSRGVRFGAAVVGDGPLRGGLEARAHALDVTLLGVRQDVPALLRKASVLLMTSDPATEGMAGVLIEAGLSGVPVVTTAAAGAADVVLDGETGFVVHSEVPDELADRLEFLLDEPTARTDFGRRARTRCASRFSMDATSGKWLAMIRQMVPASAFQEHSETTGTLAVHTGKHVQESVIEWGRQG
ncbi:glycosyltransferase [Intrasporangium calvum]|uniref:D-inositol 3-phosphate glycosyltransferase n=1 Tax=Intrasporangium calvum (strain ATCC 23552 / DSM 43043 / JCM 3097 / NBRC 12989 / NCIMB 10167 / NRRL B-3866 / 7 KIP) TaxID=710696 RepID=E6S8H3_INTC7|nr:glycosyltransferase [Intrasporangium calvum]ADU49135.1 glycosyl transferase group 1 [Intrasporangium calvum DSM 43043]